MNRYLAYAITIAAFAFIIALLLGYLPGGEPRQVSPQQVEESDRDPGGFPPGWTPGFGWEDLFNH